ncbi:MAG: hypothetical protein QXK94_08130 [Candidatus Jordarchaeales archaeon]
MSGSARSFSGIHKASMLLSIALILFSLFALSVSPNVTFYTSCYMYPSYIMPLPYFPNTPSEGFSLVYLPPKESVFTFLALPSPLSCVFGVTVSNQPLKFKVYGVHPTRLDTVSTSLPFDVLLDTEILSTTFVLTPITKNYYLLIVLWENQGDQPALLMVQSNVAFTLPHENPFTTLFRFILILGFIILAFAVVGGFSRLTQPSFTGVGGVLIGAFKLTPVTLSYVMLPMGLLLLVHSLLPTLSLLLMSPYLALQYVGLPAASFSFFLALTVVSLLAAFALWVLVLGFAVAFAYGVASQGRPMLLKSLQLSVKRFFKLAATIIVVKLVVNLGLLLLIVPGIFFSVIYALAPQAVIVEGTGVREALRRSRELTTGVMLKTFIVLLVLEAVSLTIVSIAYFTFLTASSPVLAVLTLAFMLPMLPLLFLHPPLDFNLVAFVSPSILGGCLLTSFLLSIALVIRTVGLTFWFYNLGGGVPGWYVTRAFTCRFCGNVLAEGCDYCPYCGMKLEE